MTETAESHLGKETKHAVVTVLACLKDPQRQPTKEAGVVEVTPAFEAASRNRSVRVKGGCRFTHPFCPLCTVSLNVEHAAAHSL